MAELDVINLFFNGREEFLKVLRANESIVKNLSNVKNPVCPLVGTSITLNKQLGKGKYGAVFEIDFPDKGQRKYVAKKAQVDQDLFVTYMPPPDGFGFFNTTFEDLEKRHQVAAKVIIDYNGLKAVPTDKVTAPVVIPLFKRGCNVRRKEEIERFDGKGVTTFQPGDYICEAAYTEFVIAVLVGEIYRSGQSINFLDTFYFASCITGNSLRDVTQYTFMEKIDRSLRKTLLCITENDNKQNKNLEYREDIANCVLIQIIHAIGVYQETYKIVHGDLHDDNVFLEIVTEDTLWKGQKVLDVDYYHYVVKGENLYLPGGKWCPIIVKIGDWGLACKYSSPKIAQTNTIRDGYDQLDGRGPLLPNFYTQSYDVFYVTDMMLTLNPSNEFIQNIMAWIVGLKDYTTESLLEEKEKVFNGRSRPSMESLSTTLAHVNPVAILSSKELMGKYMNLPDANDKGVIMGEIR